MKRIKQKTIAALLLIVLTLSVTATAMASFTMASAASPAGYMGYPQITVLTHGWSSSAKHWSNKEGKGAVFAYDTDSLVHKLSVKAGGANIYRAETLGGNSPSYTLYEVTVNIANETVETVHGSIINDDKHIIIVFDSRSSYDTNDVVYNEFRHMLTDVIAQVKSHNKGVNPLVNLIGHSRGGITNLQYALEFPQNVHSMISIGTPYFGSDVAAIGGRMLYAKPAGQTNVRDGLDDITDPSVYEYYYNTWTNGYESMYKDINSIAIGGTTTIEYLSNVIVFSGGEDAALLASFISLFDNTLTNELLVDAVRLLNLVLLQYFSILEETDYGKMAELVKSIDNEVHFGNWYSDVFVPIDSQQGIKENKNYNFTKFVKQFNNSNASLQPKRAVNDLPIIHNLETYDAEIHNYILSNIVLNDGDIIDNEISNVGRAGYFVIGGYIDLHRWQIKIRNTHNQARDYAYNSKMCFFEDAQNWTGLTDIIMFRLEPGETKIVEIEENGTATSVAVSSVCGTTRDIRFGENLWNKRDVYEMRSHSSSKTYYSYDLHNMKVSIAGKNGNKWLIDVTNNTGHAQSFEYNRKMCFESDAQNWTGLSDISTAYFSDGAQRTYPIEIQENGTATSIAISYLEGNTRYFFYAKNLNASGTMSANQNSVTYNNYSRNGMTVSIAGKNGNVWQIRLTNNTGSDHNFEYNQKMCFEGDAQNWTGLSNITSVYLANGASTTYPIDIQENGFATSIAICYMDGSYRRIFYAKDLSMSGTMTAMENTIDTSTPPAQCVAEGTMITLADGSQKAVENLTGDELLLVWNMETGAFDSAPILFIDNDEEMEYEVINLYFHDGSVVKVISEHAFWDLDLGEYVYLDNNAADYIGHWFSKQDTKNNGKIVSRKTKLIDVVIENEVTTAWSPVTYGHLCYYVNGMLSMPGGITGLINILDVNPKTMTIDRAALAADIEAYGLFTYEEFAEILPVPEDIYEAFNGKYLKIAIGKGLIDFDTLEALVARYAEFF